MIKVCCKLPVARCNLQLESFNLYRSCDRGLNATNLLRVNVGSMFIIIVVINVYKRFFLIFFHKNAVFNVFLKIFQRFLFLKNVEESV